MNSTDLFKTADSFRNQEESDCVYEWLREWLFKDADSFRN